MPETATTYKYLKPKHGYEALWVEGRIPATTIHACQFWPECEGWTIEQIAEDWSIAPEAVREAFAYVESKPEAIETDNRRAAAFFEAIGANDPGYKWNPKPKRLTPEDWARIDSL